MNMAPKKMVSTKLYCGQIFQFADSIYMCDHSHCLKIIKCVYFHCLCCILHLFLFIYVKHFAILKSYFRAVIAINQLESVFRLFSLNKITITTRYDINYLSHHCCSSMQFKCLYFRIESLSHSTLLC